MTDEAPVQGPVVEMPRDTRMASEPAATIGDVFASKAMLQPIVAAALAIVARITGMVVDDALVSDITTMVMFAAMVWAAVSAQVIASRRAKEQAAVTRESVYSPQTVARIAMEASTRRGVDIVDVPPEQWGINQATGKQDGADQ